MNKRNLSIEGMRGIASIAVVLSHFMVAFYPAAYWGESVMSHTTGGWDVKLAQSPVSVFYAGNFFVCIFYVICGFGFAANYFSGGGYKLKETITKRFFRLFIPILIVGFIYFLAVKADIMTSTAVADITGSEWLRTMYSFDEGIKGFITDVYYRTMFCGSSQYNSALWTVAYLLYGSFLVTFILLVWGKMKRRWIVYLFFCINLWIMGNQGTITCNYFVAFIMGAAIADWKMHTSLRIRNWFCMLLIVISIFLAGYPMGVVPTNGYRLLNIGEKSPILWHVLGAVIMIFAVVYSEGLEKILKNKIIQFIGRISFSIYLIHMLVLCSFSTSLFGMLFEQGARYAVAFVITVLVSLCVIIGAGFLVYRVVEKNVNIVLSKFICIFDKNIVI